MIRKEIKERESRKTEKSNKLTVFMINTMDKSIATIT